MNIFWFSTDPFLVALSHSLEKKINEITYYDLKGPNLYYLKCLNVFFISFPFRLLTRNAAFIYLAFKLVTGMAALNKPSVLAS